jgi:enoyl-CoA hydratase/carnithine racemase
MVWDWLSTSEPGRIEGADMQYQDVTVAIDGPIGTVTIARADANNTVRLETLQELCHALDAVVRDDAVKVVVLAGAGRHFSAGADFAFLDGLTRMTAPQIRKQVYSYFQGAARRLYHCPKPTIALVQGAAVTVGCELSLACDFRIMTDNAFLQESWIKLGIMPPLGGLFLLPRYLGLGRAMNMVLRGAKLTAAEALDAGLATEVVAAADLAEHGQALAAELAAMAPLAYAAVKEAVHRGLETGMEAEWSANVSTQATLLSSADFAEGLAAVKERRNPNFAGE